jgi:CTP synthase
MHLTLVPYIAAAKELKTKPTQHSVRELRQIGIQPDFLVCRSDRPIPEELKRKMALFCNVKANNVFEAQDVDNIYRLPLVFHEQGLDQRIVESLNIWTRSPNLKEWEQIVRRLDNPKRKCSIGIVGKYTDVLDSYKSIGESLIHAGIANESTVDVEYLDASDLTEENVSEMLKKYDGVIVPGGFGGRGIEGKIAAIQFLRENNVPFLGICLGMQLAAIEFARNVLGIKDANSIEFVPDGTSNIIHLMESQKRVERKGGTMRLGSYPCHIESGTKAHKAYGRENVLERHRHRYEFNNSYRESFRDNGLYISGVSPDGELVEIIELKDHPWFVACQFHPELKSSPLKAHPFFREFIAASLKEHAKVSDATV